MTAQTVSLPMVERKTVYKSTNLTEPALKALQLQQIRLMAVAERKLSMSEVLLAVIEVASNHPEELQAVLGRGIAANE